MQNNYANYNKKRKFKKYPKKKYKKSYISTIANKYTSNKAEIKTLDNWSSLSQLTQTPQFFILNQPILGSGFWNRIGNKITMKSLRLRFQLRDLVTSSGEAGSCFIRLMVLYDRQNNGIVSPSSDILQSVNLSGGGSTDLMGGINMNNAERYVILRDEIIPIFSNRNELSNAPTQQYISMIDGVPKNFFDWYIKLNGLETRYQNNDGDEGSISTGALYFYVWCSVASGGGLLSPFSGYYNARLRFYD